MLFFCSVQFLRLTWSFLRSGNIKTHYITFKSLLAHVKFFAGVHENIRSLQPTWPVKRIWHWQYCYGNQIRASSQQRHTKHIESVKRKHVFLDLCRKRVKKKKKKHRAVETGCIMQLEENMLSVSTMEQEPPLWASTGHVIAEKDREISISAAVMLKKFCSHSLV